MTTLDSYKCPQCGTPLMAEDMNVATDVVLCRSCSYMSTLSELLQERRDEAVLDQLPPRMNVVKTVRGLEVTYKNPRMISFYFLFFALLWNGVLSMALPAHAGRMSLFEKMFSVLFILIGLFLLMLSVYLVFGRVKLILNPGKAELFHGVGSCGRRRKFKLVKNARISIEESNLYLNRRVVKKIVVEQPEGRPFFFGTDIAEEEVQQYMAALLRQMRE